MVVVAARGIADDRLFGDLARDLDHLVLSVGGHQHARRRVAGLAAVAEALAGAMRDRAGGNPHPAG